MSAGKAYLAPCARREPKMKKLVLLLIAMASALSGCVVVPARPAYYRPAPVYYTPHYYYPAYPAPHYYYHGY